MATLNPRRFAQPDSLKAINPDRLLEFLTPYKEYLAGRGMPWPTTDTRKRRRLMTDWARFLDTVERGEVDNVVNIA